MATSVERLHYDNSTFNWTHSLDENGNQFASRIDGDPDFTEHDVLTGTRIDGTAFPAGEDRTCGNWTSNGEGSAMLGPRRSLLLHDAGFALEHRPPVTRLLTGRSGGYWRGRPVLLLCHRLMDVR